MACTFGSWSPEASRKPLPRPQAHALRPERSHRTEHKIASEESRRRGLRLFTSTVRRGRPDYLDPKLNCHSKLHEVQALVQALEAGADEALMLDINGFVATCNSTNFFIVQKGEVWTSTDQFCMNGITRRK